MADTEKITFNISVVDLGQIDLLVDEGFYSSRTDFIRTAVRNRLSVHRAELEQVVTRKSYVLGVLTYNRASLEKVLAEGQMLDVRVVGLLHIANDVDPGLALQAIHSIKLQGVMKAKDSVKEALQERML